jgi:asparagine synthetase A
MIGNPVKVTVTILQTQPAIEKKIKSVTSTNIEIIHSVNKWIKFYFSTQFVGDSTIYPSTSVVDITDGIPALNSVSNIFG